MSEDEKKIFPCLPEYDEKEMAKPHAQARRNLEIEERNYQPKGAAKKAVPCRDAGRKTLSQMHFAVFAEPRLIPFSGIVSKNYFLY